MKKKEPQKRVNVVYLQLVNESSLLCGPRRITNTRMAYELFEPYLREGSRTSLCRWIEYEEGANISKFNLDRHC